MPYYQNPGGLTATEGRRKSIAIALVECPVNSWLSVDDSQSEREQLYQDFRAGKLGGLVLSRVGNFALDLPDADVLIQVSGKYGSRQEEAQRLGRILRPKSDDRPARFYTLVSLRTCEEEFARHRQLFLTEQGYAYQIQIIS
ncbi:helicase-related protein [Aerosakkonemataceae cyanobacterium BLCC-F50]|uniref:Helicase-related protein n=1 Tax=Floridaenema flaviceps BLCC-F50 TaxID=3153642 RepID=A0ABV4XYE5_9CYAN